MRQRLARLLAGVAVLAAGPARPLPLHADDAPAAEVAPVADAAEAAQAAQPENVVDLPAIDLPAIDHAAEADDAATDLTADVAAVPKPAVALPVAVDGSDTRNSLVALTYYNQILPAWHAGPLIDNALFQAPATEFAPDADVRLQADLLTVADSELRARTVVSLGSSRNALAREILLAARATEQEPTVLADLLVALRVLYIDDAAAVALPYLSSADAGVRLRAVQLYASQAGADLKPLADRVAGEGDLRVRRALLTPLAARPAVIPVTTWLRWADAPDFAPEHRWLAIAAVAAYPTPGADAIARLDAWRSDADQGVRIAVVSRLSLAEAPGARLAWLAAAVKDRHESVRSAAAIRLGEVAPDLLHGDAELRAATLDAVRPYLRDEDLEVRYQATKSAAVLAPLPDTLPDILPMLGDPDSRRIRNIAEDALAILAADRDSRYYMRPLLADANPERRFHAAHLIARLHYFDLVPDLIARLAFLDNPEATPAGAVPPPDVAPADAPADAPVAAAAAPPKVYAKRPVVESVPRLLVADINAIVSLLEEENQTLTGVPMYRHVAATTDDPYLARLVVAREAIRAHAAHPDPTVRAAVARAIGRLGDTLGAEQLRTWVDDDPSVLVLNAALESMGRLPHEQFSDSLIQVLRATGPTETRVNSNSRGIACWATAFQVDPAPALVSRLFEQMSRAVIPTPMGPVFEGEDVRVAATLALVEQTRRSPDHGAEVKAMQAIELLGMSEEDTVGRPSPPPTGPALRVYSDQIRRYLENQPTVQYPIPQNTFAFFYRGIDRN